MSARANATVERGLDAEYLLKSSVNLALALIKSDQDPNQDGPNDDWAKFSSGVPVPPDLLGLTEPNLRIQVEITPENQKFPIKKLMQATTSSVPTVVPTIRDMLARLFQQLGFDGDTNEVVTSGVFTGRYFDSKGLVSNLIDYMDDGDDSYQDPNYPTGIESDLPKGTFPNKPIERIAELASIPGFTPHRMQILESFLTTYDDSKININFAPPQVIRALDPQIGDPEVSAIIAQRSDPKDGPLTSGDGKFQSIVGSTIFQSTTSIVGYNSRYFQVIAKIEYGPQAFYARAIATRDGGPNGEPDIYSMEMF